MANVSHDAGGAKRPTLLLEDVAVLVHICIPNARLVASASTHFCWRQLPGTAPCEYSLAKSHGHTESKSATRLLIRTITPSWTSAMPPWRYWAMAPILLLASMKSGPWQERGVRASAGHGNARAE